MKRPPLITDNGRGRNVQLCGTDLSMSDLARATGYSLTLVSLVFGRRKKASTAAIGAFAEALGISEALLTDLLEKGE